MKGDSMYNEDKEKKENKTTQNNISRFFRKRTKRLLTDIDKLFNKIMWYQIILSVILIILGLVFLIWTAASFFFGFVCRDFTVFIKIQYFFQRAFFHGVSPFDWDEMIFPIVQVESAVTGPSQ